MNVWNAFQELDRIRDEFDRALDPRRNRFGDGRWRLAFLPGYGARRYPLVNVFEEKDAYVIEALAPGLDPKQVNVTVVGNVLTLSGEKTRGNGDVKPEAVHRSERAAGKFVRSVELPAEVDSEKVSAEYKNGILKINAPKHEKARPRAIEVKVG
ncbi:MAG: Hsp20 family protein [bacterium]|nr:Hsp20 family protein [bacterium]